jgi:hypothetical protein
MSDNRKQELCWKGWNFRKELLKLHLTCVLPGSDSSVIIFVIFLCTFSLVIYYSCDFLCTFSLASAAGAFGAGSAADGDAAASALPCLLLDVQPSRRWTGASCCCGSGGVALLPRAGVDERSRRRGQAESGRSSPPAR